MAFHPRNPLLATAGNDGMVRLWNTVTGAMRTEIQTNTGKVGAIVHAGRQASVLGATTRK